MTKLEQIKAAAAQIARGYITNEQARNMLPECRFEMMVNGRCYWRCSLSGLQGSEK